MGVQAGQQRKKQMVLQYTHGLGILALGTRIPFPPPVQLRGWGRRGTVGVPALGPVTDALSCQLLWALPSPGELRPGPCPGSGSPGVSCDQLQRLTGAPSRPSPLRGGPWDRQAGASVETTQAVQPFCPNTPKGTPTNLHPGLPPRVCLQGT